MSIHYTLYLVGDETPAEAMHAVGESMGVNFGSDLETEALEGIVLRAKAVKPPMDQFIKEDHGLQPKIGLSMFLDKSDLRTGEASVVAVLKSVLQRSDADVLLLRQDETMAYRRINGETETAESDPIWSSPKHRAKVDSRRRGSLP